jgi:voltage-gated potassium channel
MHRLCGAHGLTHIGSATLPDMFPALLDPGRRALVMEAVDAPMREVVLDLVINQTFRRDLFARGACPPSTPWRRQSLADLQLGRRSGALVLAVRNPEGDVREGNSAPSLIANPGGHVRLEPGQLLVVLGSQEQLSRLRDLLGEALVDVAVMPA